MTDRRIAFAACMQIAKDCPNVWAALVAQNCALAVWHGLTDTSPWTCGDCGRTCVGGDEWCRACTPHPERPQVIVNRTVVSAKRGTGALSR